MKIYSNSTHGSNDFHPVVGSWYIQTADVLQRNTSPIEKKKERQNY